MSVSKEQIIVINDLLSFMSCKIKVLQKNELLKYLRDFYSESDADEALKTFLKSLPLNNHNYQMNWEGNDAFLVLYEFLKLSKDDYPMFVCKDLNNVPKIDSYNIPSYNDDNHIDLLKEQKYIKSQISEISSVVYQLKNQIQLLSKDKKLYNNRLKGTQNFNEAKEESQSVVKTYIEKREEYEDDFLEPSDEEYEEIVDNKQALGQRENESHTKENRNVTICKQNQAHDGEENESDIENEYSSQTVIHINNDEKLSSDELVNSDCETELPKRISLHGDDTSTTEDEEEMTSNETEGRFPFIVVEQVFDENVGNFSIYRCSFCNFNTNDSSAVQLHNCKQMYSEDPDDIIGEGISKTFRYFCLDCRFKCKSKLLYKQHTQTHPQLFPCPFCRVRNLSNEIWTSHVLKCLAENEKNSDDYVCQVCGIIYANTSALISHKGFHDSSKPLKCLKCKYRFYTQETLNRHFKSHFKRGYKCPFCHFINKNKTTLVTHIRCHTGEMPFSCEHCDYRSRSQTNLSSHMLSHSNKKPIKCEECPAMFKSMDKMKSHKIKHMKNRAHKCPVCQKAFKTGWLMNLHHQHVHLDVRPYSCTQCSYKARSRSALKSHCNTHSNIKAFQCELCQFKANHKGHLNRHMRFRHAKLMSESLESGAQSFQNG